MNKLIDDNYYFENIDGYYANIAGHKVWIENHPYSSFTTYLHNIKVRPSRLTIERSHRHLIKSIIKQYEK